MTRTRSTAEVARILGVSEDRVRELARTGLARPAGRGHRYAFRFRDLVALRAARDLVDLQRLDREVSIRKRAYPTVRRDQGSGGKHLCSAQLKPHQACAIVENERKPVPSRLILGQRLRRPFPVDPRPPFHLNVPFGEYQRAGDVQKRKRIVMTGPAIG